MLLQKLTAVLDSALALSATTRGCIQLFDNKTLKIVAERGYSDSWLLYWESVSFDQGSCGNALSRKKSFSIPDVRNAKNIYKDEALAIQLQENIYASHSTPIVSDSGQLLGMLSIHYNVPTDLQSEQLLIIDSLAKHAADIIDFHKEYRLLEQNLKSHSAVFVKNPPEL